MISIFNRLCLVAIIACSASTASAASQTVMDASGSLKAQGIPSSFTNEKLVAVISSPDTPSSSNLGQNIGSEVLSLDTSAGCLICRGPTLSVKASDPECVSVALCSLTAAALVLDGITEGDVEAGLKNSRHAVTLTALFRAKVALGSNGGEDGKSSGGVKQALVLYVEGEISNALEKRIKGEVLSLYSAAAAETKDVPNFDKAYDLQIVSSEAQSATEVC